MVSTVSAVAQPADDPEAGNEPYQLVRSLRAVQDRVARGSEQAHIFQRRFIEKITQNILVAGPEVWKDRRNVRAAVIYALSGGDPRVLREAMTKFVAAEADDKLWRGAIAYAEGRTVEAARLLLPLEPRAADPGLGGQIALIQAVLTVRDDAAKAIKLLDEARLLAPGTLVEEAALRRQVTLIAAAGDLDLFEVRAMHYLRRFGKSIYAPGFLQQFVRVLVSTPAYASDRARVQRLKAALETLDVPVRRDAFLAIAEEAIVRGKVELTRLAARRAAELVNDENAVRVRVYEAAALIVTEEYEQGLGMLSAIDRKRLDETDASLLEAALALAGEVRRAPGTTDLQPVPPSPVRLRAERAISQVDEFLPGASKRGSTQ